VHSHFAGLSRQRCNEFLLIADSLNLWEVQWQDATTIKTITFSIPDECQEHSQTVQIREACCAKYQEEMEVAQEHFERNLMAKACTD
jgi:hypothetical protein